MEKIRAGGGTVYSLVTNFRSNEAVLTVVNNVFDRLFQPAEHIQPGNEPLAVKPQRKPEVSVSGAPPSAPILIPPTSVISPLRSM